jgi:4-hydroxy-tetrahydrodipicolinate reductase
LTIQVVVVGLGATGRAMASSLMRRADVEVVGADSPDTAGQAVPLFLESGLARL